MSARASAYAKTLTMCPNGEMISPREKLVLIVLADAHQDKAKHFTYPAIETLAEDAMCDRRSCQRYLAALERKGVIKRMRPAHQGRGMQVFYFFAALDVVPEGWQPAALFDPPILRKRAAKGRQKGGERAAGAQLALVERAQEPEPQLEQKQIQHPLCPPHVGEERVQQEDADAGKTKGSPASVEGNCVPIRAEQPETRGMDGGNDTAASGELAGGTIHPRATTADVRATAGAGVLRGNRPGEGGKLGGSGKRADSAVLKLPDSGGDGQAAVERAVAQVRSALSVSNERKCKLLRGVIAMAAEKGEEPPTIALDIIAAVRDQDREYAAGHLKFTYGLNKFLGEGIWRNRNRWPWDIEALRMEAAARVGSV